MKVGFRFFKVLKSQCKGLSDGKHAFLITQVSCFKMYGDHYMNVYGHILESFQFLRRFRYSEIPYKRAIIKRRIYKALGENFLSLNALNS